MEITGAFLVNLPKGGLTSQSLDLALNHICKYLSSQANTNLGHTEDEKKTRKGQPLRENAILPNVIVLVVFVQNLATN